MAKAATKRAQPGKLMLPYRRTTQAVTGQAANPENKANQPLVGGQGPNVAISPRPPIIVSSPQAQASTQPMIWSNRLEEWDCFITELLDVMTRHARDSDSQTF